MEAINDEKMENMIKYFLSGGTAGEYINTNEQGFNLMEASNTHTITATIDNADPSRPVFIIQQADIQDPRIGAYLARFPSGVSGRAVFDLYPISDLYLPVPAMNTTSDRVANAYFTLGTWPSGTRTGATPYTPSACGFYPLALNDGAGYGVANSNFTKTFNLGYTGCNRIKVRTTTVDAGNNALQGSIYGGIIHDKLIPSVATKSGIAGLTTAHNGSFLSCGILDPVVSVLSPSTQEVSYFTNNMIRERSQSRVLQSKFQIPTPTYSMRWFGVDSNQDNGQGFPVFNAIKENFFYNQQAFRVDSQWYGRRKAIDTQQFSFILTLYADWGTVDSGDNLQITSVTCNQFNVVMPDKDFVLPFSSNLSCQVRNPIAPEGASINPMTFYFIGLRITCNLLDQSGNLLPVDEFIDEFAMTTTISIDDLSLTGDEVGAVIAINDYTGPFEVTQDVRYSVIPNALNTALLGGYTVPPTYEDVRKTVKLWLATTFGRSGGMLGTESQYEEVVSKSNLFDKVFLEAPLGGHTMSSYLRSLRTKGLSPSRGVSGDSYFAKSFLQKLKGIGRKLHETPAGRGLIGVAKGVYKVGGDMLYDELEDMTGVDVKELRDTYRSGSYRMSSYSKSQTREYGCNSYDPSRCLPATIMGDYEHPEVNELMDKPHVAMALIKLMLGKHSDEDRSLLQMALASVGKILHSGHTASSAPRPLPEIDESYGQVINGSRVVKIGATVPAIQRLALKTSTAKGRAKFIAVGPNAGVSPLILTLTVHAQMPRTRQNFEAVYFDETPNGIELTTGDRPVSFVIYFSTLFGLSQAPQEVLDSLIQCITYLRRCSIQFGNSDYVTISDSYVGEPLSGDSFFLAFTAACLNVPIGPVFTGTVSSSGIIGRVGDIDNKISAIAQLPDCLTLFIPEQELSEASRALVEQTIARVSYFRMTKDKCSIMPVHTVAMMLMSLNSTIMSGSVYNARTLLQQVRGPDGEVTSVTYEPFKVITNAVKEVKLKSGESASREADNKIIRDIQRTFRSEVYKMVSDNKANLSVDGERIDNLTLGAFKKSRPFFGVLDDKGNLDLPQSLSKEVSVEVSSGPVVVRVLDASALEKVVGKRKVQLKQKSSPLMEDEW